MLSSFAISSPAGTSAAGRGMARERILMHALRSIYATTAYAATALAFLYAAAAAFGADVPRLHRVAPAGRALIDAGLLGLFALHHHYVQRAAGAWRWLPAASESVERATDCLAAATLLFVVFYGWQPVPGLAWSVKGPVPVAGLWSAFGLGWLLLVDVGWRLARDTVRRPGRDRRRSHPGRRPPAVRPVSPAFAARRAAAGLALVTWCVPSMTWGHLLFATAATGYALCHVQFESKRCAARAALPRDWPRQSPG